ncbi:hypothetical protein D3C78_1845610 [compost metagenome]
MLPHESEFLGGEIAGEDGQFALGEGLQQECHHGRIDTQLLLECRFAGVHGVQSGQPVGVGIGVTF